MSPWQWIATAPHNKALLCYWSSPMFADGDWRYGVAKHVNGEWIDPETKDGFVTDPTHWMPLPEAP